MALQSVHIRKYYFANVNIFLTPIFISLYISSSVRAVFYKYCWNSIKWQNHCSEYVSYKLFALNSSNGRKYMHVSSFIVVIMVDWKPLSFMCIVTAFNMEDSERTQLLSDHGPDTSPRIVVEVPRGNASADPARKKLRTLQTSSTSALDSVEVPNNPQTYISNTHSISLEDNHLDRLKIS